MDIDKAAEARSRMVSGFYEFVGGLVDLVTLAFADLAKTLGTFDWSGLAKLKESDPDLFSWTASGPIRRVQLRRARALMEERKWQNYTRH